MSKVMTRICGHCGRRLPHTELIQCAGYITRPRHCSRLICAECASDCPECKGLRHAKPNRLCPECRICDPCGRELNSCMEAAAEFEEARELAEALNTILTEHDKNRRVTPASARLFICAIRNLMTDY